MPATLTALTIFALAIAPGFLFVQAYSTRRVHSAPERDLYALAQAVVASLIWLSAVWLLLLKLGDPVRGWGLIPYVPHRLEQERGEVVLLGLLVVLTPYIIGLLAARVAARLDRAGITRPDGPTTWDEALRAAGYSAQELAAAHFDVTIRLKSGVTIFGRYGPRALADLSPRPQRDVFLDTGFGVLDPDRLDDQWASPLVVFENTDPTSGGIFVKGSEIEAIAIEIG